MSAGARDKIYGRRGGGWVPEGHDPMAAKLPVEAKEPTKTERDDVARKERQRAEVAAYELDHDLVPGTASHNGDGPGGGPTGGVPWAGRARMADARRYAGKPLDDRDREALRRFPIAEPVSA